MKIIKVHGCFIDCPYVYMDAPLHPAKCYKADGKSIKTAMGEFENDFPEKCPLEDLPVMLGRSISGEPKDPPRSKNERIDYPSGRKYGLADDKKVIAESNLLTAKEGTMRNIISIGHGVEIEGDCFYNHTEITALLVAGERIPFNIHDIEKQFEEEYLWKIRENIKHEKEAV